MPDQSQRLGDGKNDHSPRARRRKMKRFLDKNFPIKKTKDNEKSRD